MRSKTYKLIYERNGKIYASKSGWPAAGDVLIADVSLLEGTLSPNILRIIEAGEYDVRGYDKASVEVPPTVDPANHSVDFHGDEKVEPVDPKRPGVRVLSVGPGCAVEGNTLVLG